MLLSAGDLGAGQTIAAQGIVHGGTKYSLAGLLSGSAAAIREMPELWRACVAGTGPVDLSGARVRSSFCHLWQTRSIASVLGMLGARIGLETAPVEIAACERPAVLRDCPGPVMRLEEPVLDVPSILACFERRHRDRLLRIDAERGLSFGPADAGGAPAVRLADPAGGRPGVELCAKRLVLAAGAGNAALRERLGLAGAAMQRRPLHMVLLRGELPPLYGHCIEGAGTRVTITTVEGGATAAQGAGGGRVWQVGGQLAEDGVRMEGRDLIRHARAELAAALPGLALADIEAATYRVDRAEGRGPAGGRPEGPVLLEERAVLTAWPTKMALAPRLAESVLGRLPEPAGRHGAGGKRGEKGGCVEGAESARGPVLADWPRPCVAAPPWEEERPWSPVG